MLFQMVSRVVTTVEGRVGHRAVLVGPCPDKFAFSTECQDVRLRRLQREAQERQQSRPTASTGTTAEDVITSVAAAAAAAVASVDEAWLEKKAEYNFMGLSQRRMWRALRLGADILALGGCI